MRVGDLVRLIDGVTNKLIVEKKHGHYRISSSTDPNSWVIPFQI